MNKRQFLIEMAALATMTIEFGVMHAISRLNTQTASVKENRIIVKIFGIN